MKTYPTGEGIKERKTEICLEHMLFVEIFISRNEPKKIKNMLCWCRYDELGCYVGDYIQVASARWAHDGGR